MHTNRTFSYDAQFLEFKGKAQEQHRNIGVQPQSVVFKYCMIDTTYNTQHIIEPHTRILATGFSTFHVDTYVSSKLLQTTIEERSRSGVSFSSNSDKSPICLLRE